MKVTLPEAYIFDILSIYEVKYIKAKEDKPMHLNNFNGLLLEIEQQVGKELLNNIIHSKEYEDLLKANTETFNLVDLVKTNPCLGREVDSSNYKRFLAKKSLQKKFFTNDYSELKIGYINEP
jgi:hypothetical protein